MEFLKEFEKFRTNKDLNESAIMKIDDVYKVKAVIDVPQSLINALIRKVKDESEKNAREFWSDIDIANEVVKYISTNFMNIENLPASILMGETDLAAQPAATAQPEAQAQPAQPAQPAVEAQPEAQPAAQEEPAAQEPTEETPTLPEA